MSSYHTFHHISVITKDITVGKSSQARKNCLMMLSKPGVFFGNIKTFEKRLTLVFFYENICPAFTGAKMPK